MNEILKEIDEILALDESSAMKKLKLTDFILEEKHNEWVRWMRDAEAIFLNK